MPESRRAFLVALPEPSVLVPVPVLHLQRWSPCDWAPENALRAALQARHREDRNCYRCAHDRCVVNRAAEIGLLEAWVASPGGRSCSSILDSLSDTLFLCDPRRDGIVNNADSLPHQLLSAQRRNELPIV